MRTDFGSPKITIIVAVIVLTIGGIVEWLIHGINNIDWVKRELYVVSLCHWDYHNNSNNTLAIQKMDFKKDG